MVNRVVFNRLGRVAVYRILLVTTNYWPEPTGISVYTTDFTESLLAAGYQVKVLTSLPHYPWWNIPEEFRHLGEGETLHRGISVLRVKHFVPSKMNILLRIRFEASLWWNLRRTSRKLIKGEFDLVIACIPTVAAGIIGQKISKNLDVPFGLIVQDLSGAGAKQAGLRGGAVISRIAQFVEVKVLKGADSLVVISPAMREIVKKSRVPEKRITQIANYSAKQISIREKSFARAKFDWPLDQFVVIHTGNIGAKQDLENVVRAAEAVSNHPQIKFYLVGHGNQEFRLKTLCKGKKNISVLPAVSEEEYSLLLAAADLLLVNERVSQMEMSLPSKLTSYLFSGRPVIAAVPRDGATWNLLEGVAELVEAGNPKLLAQAIIDLSQNNEKRIELADKGLEFARINLGADIGRKKYLDWVNGLIESKRG